MASASNPSDRSIGLSAIVAHLSHPDDSYIELSPADSKYSMLTLNPLGSQDKANLTTIKLANGKSITCLESQAQDIRNIYARALECKDTDLTTSDLAARTSVALPKLSLGERIINAAKSALGGDILLPHELPKSARQTDSAYGSGESVTASTAPPSAAHRTPSDPLQATLQSLRAEVDDLSALSRELLSDKRKLNDVKLALKESVDKVRTLPIKIFHQNIDQQLKELGRTIHQEEGVVQTLTRNKDESEATFNERAEAISIRLLDTQSGINRSIPEGPDRDQIKAELTVLNTQIEALKQKQGHAGLTWTPSAPPMDIVAGVLDTAQQTLTAFSTKLDSIIDQKTKEETLFSYDRDTDSFTAEKLGTTLGVNRLRDPRLEKAFIQTGVSDKGRPIGIYCKERDQGRFQDLIRHLSSLGEADIGVLTDAKKDIYRKILSVSRPPL